MKFLKGKWMVEEETFYDDCISVKISLTLLLDVCFLVSLRDKKLERCTPNWSAFRFKSNLLI